MGVRNGLHNGLMRDGKKKKRFCETAKDLKEEYESWEARLLKIGGKKKVKEVSKTPALQKTARNGGNRDCAYSPLNPSMFSERRRKGRTLTCKYRMNNEGEGR